MWVEKRKLWTEKKVGKVEVLATEYGKSAAEIADAMGMTRNSIIGICWRRGIQLPSPGKKLYSDDEVHQIIQLRKDGVKNHDIAKKLNRTFESVRDKVHHLIARGLVEKRGGGWRPAKERVERA